MASLITSAFLEEFPPQFAWYLFTGEVVLEEQQGRRRWRRRRRKRRRRIRHALGRRDDRSPVGHPAMAHEGGRQAARAEAPDDLFRDDLRPSHMDMDMG